MLVKLSVKNFALISQLELEFGKELNILSGETGAGKSIIVDCIMLLAGGRYDKTMLRFGENSGYVEGVFTVPENISPSLSDFLSEEDEEIIIFRRFNSDGKNEIKINGRSATVSMLKAISASLIDICGQNEHQSLANVANHIKIVDYYARHNISELLKNIGENYAKLRDVNSKLEEIGDAKSRARNLDVYKFQLNEIDKAKLKKGEEEELTSMRKRYLGAEKIASALSDAVSYLSDYSEGLSAQELLEDAERNLSSLSGYDSRYAEWADRIKSVAIEVEDLSESISDELSSLEFSPEELDALEKRLDTVRNITRKYGDYDSAMSFRAELVKKIDEIENAEDYYLKLSKDKTELLKLLYEDCLALSKTRQKAAKELETSVVKELSELGMAESVFEVKFEPLPDLSSCENFISASGMDKVEFYLSPNAGQPLKPLVKIISGGELSRLMLALKVVSSSVDDTPTVIFDEIDTGISGKIGAEIAKKLARLALKHQLLCVTHLPQIASMADTHYFIDKYTEGGQTFTRLTLLDENASIEEVSRLSGAKDISTEAFKNAAQMKKWSDNYKLSIKNEANSD